MQVFILNILHCSALFLSSWDARGPGIIILTTIPPLRSAPGPGGQEIFRSSATKHPWREKERSRLLLRPFPSCAACPRGIWQDGNKGKGWGRTRCWGRPVATSCLCCRVLEVLGASSSPGFPHPGCSPRIVGAASPGFPQVLQGQSHAVFPKPHRGVKVLQNLPNPPRLHLPSPAGRSWRLPRGPHATFWVQTIINIYIFSPLSPSAPGILIALVRWVSFCTLLKMLVKPVL